MGREIAGSSAIAALAALVIATGATAAASSRSSSIHACGSFQTAGLAVSSVKANRPCGYTRAVIRRLLRNGIERIPGVNSSRKGWRCRKRGSLRSCRRPSARRHGRRLLKVSFRVKPRPSPAPPACIGLWNTFEAVPPSPNLGIHFYGDAIHNARRAWVSLVDDPQGGQRCAVIMVVAITDIEFGTDGEFSQPGPNPPWVVMTSTSVPWFHRYEAQAAAPAKANASLDAAGKLAPLF
jgi:hypothetical protein